MTSVCQHCVSRASARASKAVLPLLGRSRPLRDHLLLSQPAAPRYVGPTNFADGDWVGVELFGEDPSRA
eukprot:6432332-Pyramimonas_sp.AAC.1